MDTGIIIAIGALGGTLLGFILNELSSYFRHRGEDKRQMRQALFNLMNLHYLTAPLEFTHANSALDEWICSYDPLVAKTFTTEQLRDFVRQFIEPLIAPLRQEALQSLCGSYEQTITNLAAIDPLLAFSLSGRSRAHFDIRRYLNSIESLCRSGPLPADDEAGLSAQLAAARDFCDGELRDTLEDDVRAVARRISWVTRFRVNRYLKRKRTEFDIELKGKLSSLLDSLASKDKKPRASQ